MYHLLGKLPKATIDFFLAEVLKRKQPRIPYQWIQFDDFLHNEFLKIFSNTELEIQKQRGRPIQKAFYSDPGHGFRIHKDGLNCRSAMNIALSCNPTDWVRWYDEDYINSITQPVVTVGSFADPDSKPAPGKFGSSRNIDIKEYESIPFIDEQHNQVGDVYVLDVDTYHSFKCVGNSPRIIIQTKFEDYPDFETIKKSLSENSFYEIIK